MRCLVIAFVAGGALAVAAVLPVAAQAAPCNDTNGDGSPSGFEYAQFHVAVLAHEGLIGRVHKPGEHQVSRFASVSTTEGSAREPVQKGWVDGLDLRIIAWREGPLALATLSLGPGRSTSP
jgi:hypothetical protein